MGEEGEGERRKSGRRRGERKSGRRRGEWRGKRGFPKIFSDKSMGWRVGRHSSPPQQTGVPLGLPTPRSSGLPCPSPLGHPSSAHPPPPRLGGGSSGGGGWVTNQKSQSDPHSRLEWGGGLGHEPKSQLDANRTSGRYRRRRSGKGKRERRGRKAMGSGRMRRAQGGEAALRAVVTSL